MADLYKEAEYIMQQTRALEELRKKHRQEVLKLLENPGDDASVLMEILRMTEKEIED